MILPKKNPLWLAVSLAATAYAGHAGAQPAPDLETVQVTANRLPQLQADVLASTTVIDRDEIERSQAGSLVELLQGRAGIEMPRLGPRGGQTSLFLRGTESDHSLVLVNGVRIANGADGLAAWQRLPLDGIAQVEIVRGPRAALYGADTIGGVINIITLDAAQPGQQATLSLRAGGDGTHRQSGWFSSAEGDTRLSAQIGQERSDGFSARDDNDEADGFDGRNAQLRLDQGFGEAADLSLGLFHASTDADYDDCGFPASIDCREEGRQLLLDASLVSHLDDDWDLTLSAARNRDDVEQFREGARRERVISARNQYGLRSDWYLASGVASLGVDYRDESVDARGGDFKPGGYEVDSRQSHGVYAAWQGQYGRHALSTSLRHDDDNRFGSETTGSLGYGFDLTANQRIGISHGTAFKAPNLIDLYTPFLFTTGNPDLDAETSRTTEAFWRLSQDAWHLGISAYQTDIDDLISFEGPNFTPINIDESRIRGVELSSGWEGEALRLALALTWQDPEDRSTGERLRRRAERFARLDADYRLGDWNLGTTLRAASDRRDIDADSFAPSQVAGYGVVDLRTSWRVTPTIELSAKLENVFDKDYQLVDGYNTQDRYLEGGVTLRF